MWKYKLIVSTALLSFMIVIVLLLTGCTSHLEYTEPEVTVPWPNVEIYTDPSSSIITQVNETFAIVVPNPPIPHGWVWQNKDPSAFSLVDQASVSVLGTPSVLPPPGNMAYLFKALKVGTFQILLVETDKSGQIFTSDSFSVIVNP